MYFCSKILQQIFNNFPTKPKWYSIFVLVALHFKNVNIKHEEPLSYLVQLEKPTVLLRFSFTLTLLPYSQHFWYFWSPNMWKFSPRHEAVFQDTSWMFYNLTVRSHRLKTQFHKTAPIPPQLSIGSSRSPGNPQLLSNLATNWRFLQPASVSLLESLMELRETLTFTSL